MKSKVLLLLSMLTISWLSADQPTEIHEPSISYEQLIAILSKYSNHPKGWSPLNYAIEEGDYASAVLLVEYTADLNKIDSQKNALARLFEKTRQPSSNLRIPLTDLQVKLIRKMIDCGVEIHYKNAPYFSLLSQVCLLGRVDLTIELLDKGVDVNECFGSPLNSAIQSKNIELVQILISRDADVNFSNSLSQAIHLKNNERIDVLIASGAHLDPKTHGINLALALHMQDVEIVNLLLVHGANPNATDHQGQYPSKSILGVAVEIYNRPADKYEKYDLRRKNLSAIIELLIQYGAKI